MRGGLLSVLSKERVDDLVLLFHKFITVDHRGENDAFSVSAEQDVLKQLMSAY